MTAYIQTAELKKFTKVWTCKDISVYEDRYGHLPFTKAIDMMAPLSRCGPKVQGERLGSKQPVFVLKAAMRLPFSARLI